MCTSKDTLERQVATIESYAAENVLTLNASKCEIVIVSSQKAISSVVCSIAGQPLQPSSSARCLGYWWSWDLSADASIDVAISKARKCFFAFGSMGAFQGQISPLSGQSIFEQCVIPILLYGSENWFLTEPLLRKLVQEEIGRRILRLTRFHSGRAVRLALSWPSMASRLLQRKLLFLQRVMSTARIVSHQLLHGLLSSPTTPIQLIDGCLHT